jgi:hypothetical protein
MMRVSGQKQIEVVYHLHAWLSFYPSTHISTCGCLSIYLSIYLSTYLSIIYLYLALSSIDMYLHMYKSKDFMKTRPFHTNIFCFKYWLFHVGFLKNGWLSFLWQVFERQMHRLRKHVSQLITQRPHMVNSDSNHSKKKPLNSFLKKN